MLKGLDFLVLLAFLFDNSTSFNVLIEYEYLSRTAIQRPSKAYDNPFKTERGQFWTEHCQFCTEQFCDKYQNNPEIIRQIESMMKILG